MTLCQQCFLFFRARKFCQQFFLSFTHDILSAVFHFFDTGKFPRSFFFSLTHDILSAVFFPICCACNVLLKRCEMFIVFIMFYIRIEVYSYSKSSDSFVDIWGIHYRPTCTYNTSHKF